MGRWGACIDFGSALVVCVQHRQLQEGAFARQLTVDVFRGMQGMRADGKCLDEL